MLTCKKCLETKPEDEFYRHKSKPSGRAEQCKTCRAAYREANRDTINAKRNADIQKNRENINRWRRERHERDPEGERFKEWTKYIKYMYQLTPELYQALFDYQDGLCGICLKEDGSGRRLAVDHDRRCCSGKRSCGKCVRGLLCYSCNTKLGWFEIYEAEALTWRDSLGLIAAQSAGVGL